jgi:hypothetical protein
MADYIKDCLSRGHTTQFCNNVVKDTNTVLLFLLIVVVYIIYRVINRQPVRPQRHVFVYKPDHVLLLMYGLVLLCLFRGIDAIALSSLIHNSIIFWIGAFEIVDDVD